MSAARRYCPRVQVRVGDRTIAPGVVFEATPEAVSQYDSNVLAELPPETAKPPKSKRYRRRDMLAESDGA